MRNDTKEGATSGAPLSVDGRAGFMLVEVVIGIVLVVLLVMALFQSVTLARHLTHANAQRVGAFGMCKARLEQLRGMDYADLSGTNFVMESDLQFTHLSGKEQLPIHCVRSLTFTPQANPQRTDVQVTVAWTYRGTPFREQLNGVIYPK
jgi:Tfp pilus assembly protein PilX